MICVFNYTTFTYSNSSYSLSELGLGVSFGFTISSKYLVKVFYHFPFLFRKHPHLAKVFLLDHLQQLLKKKHSDLHQFILLIRFNPNFPLQSCPIFIQLNKLIFKNKRNYQKIFRCIFYFPSSSTKKCELLSMNAQKYYL